LVFLLGGARRSIRSDGFHHDVQQQNNGFANGLEVAVEEREVFNPAPRRTGIFRRTEPPAGVSSEEFKRSAPHRTATFFRFGPGRAKVALQASSGSDENQLAPKSRREVLRGAVAAGVLLPLAATADTLSNLGLSRSDLGLKELPPPPPLDPKAQKEAERKAAELKRAEERSAADAAGAAARAEAAKARAEEAAAKKRAKDAKAEEVEKAAARKKELEELGLSPKALGLDGKPPRRTKPLTDKEKRQQKKKQEEVKKKRAKKKTQAKKVEESAKREAERSKKDLDNTKASLEFYKKEVLQKELEAAKKEAQYRKALEKERSI